MRAGFRVDKLRVDPHPILVALDRFRRHMLWRFGWFGNIGLDKSIDEAIEAKPLISACVEMHAIESSAHLCKCMADELSRFEVRAERPPGKAGTPIRRGFAACRSCSPDRSGSSGIVHDAAAAILPVSPSSVSCASSWSSSPLDGDTDLSVRTTGAKSAAYWPVGNLGLFRCSQVRMTAAQVFCEPTRHNPEGGIMDQFMDLEDSWSRRPERV